MIDKKYQIGVPIVNPEEKMMPHAPAIREYVSGIQGGRPVEIKLLDNGFYFGVEVGELETTGKMTIPAGMPVYSVSGNGAVHYVAGSRNYDNGTSKHTNEFSTEDFVGVLTDDFVLEAKDFAGDKALIPASIMTVGSVNINATGIGAGWFKKLLAAPYQGIKFESDEVVNEGML